jgi:hypothetical protein
VVEEHAQHRLGAGPAGALRCVLRPRRGRAPGCRGSSPAIGLHDAVERVVCLGNELLKAAVAEVVILSHHQCPGRFDGPIQARVLGTAPRREDPNPIDATAILGSRQQPGHGRLILPLVHDQGRADSGQRVDTGEAGLRVGAQRLEALQQAAVGVAQRRRLHDLGAAERVTGPLFEQCRQLTDACAVVLGRGVAGKVTDVEEGHRRAFGQLAQATELAQHKEELGVRSTVVGHDQPIEAVKVAVQQPDQMAGRDRVERHGRQVAKTLRVHAGVGPQPNGHHPGRHHQFVGHVKADDPNDRSSLSGVPRRMPQWVERGGGHGLEVSAERRRDVDGLRWRGVGSLGVDHLSNGRPGAGPPDRGVVVARAHRLQSPGPGNVTVAYFTYWRLSGPVSVSGCVVALAAARRAPPGSSPRPTVPATKCRSDRDACGRMDPMSGYKDRWIECTDAGVEIRWYYFPWGTKRIPYTSIRSVKRFTADRPGRQGPHLGHRETSRTGPTSTRGAPEKVRRVLPRSRPDTSSPCSPPTIPTHSRMRSANTCTSGHPTDRSGTSAARTHPTGLHRQVSSHRQPDDGL